MSTNPKVVAVVASIQNQDLLLWRLLEQNPSDVLFAKTILAFVHATTVLPYLEEHEVERIQED